MPVMSAFFIINKSLSQKSKVIKLKVGKSESGKSEIVESLKVGKWKV